MGPAEVLFSGEGLFWDKNELMNLTADGGKGVKTRQDRPIYIGDRGTSKVNHVNVRRER
jgi:hypothetical protein